MAAMNLPSAALLPPHTSKEPIQIEAIINILGMQVHPEGGYYVETDRDTLRVPNPFIDSASTSKPGDDSTRSASTTIFYLLTPKSPIGRFHRNKARTVHTLHKGRGVYVIIHADEIKQGNGKARVEVFTVGQDISKGERLQWIVEGGKYKATFLLAEGGGHEGLLISETVIPGFEFTDHDFMKPEGLQELTTPAEAEQLSWLLSQNV